MSTATRPSPARGLWAVPIVLVLVLLVALGVTLGDSRPRLTGTNSVPQRKQEIGLAPGQLACQGSQLMPAGSGAMRMFIGPGEFGGTPRATMTIRQSEDGIVGHSRGRLVPPDSPDAWVPPGLDTAPTMMNFTIDPPVRNTRTDAFVCVRNTGRQPIVLRGVISTFGNTQIGKRKLDFALTVLWFAPKRKTWLGDLGAIAPRVGRARMGGTWPFWIASLLLLGAFGAALASAIRENAR